jgi:succinate dehydrogenase / fumarate reductase, membrane anchor subunit
MENPLTQETMQNPFAQEPKASSTWYWQVLTGVALLLLLGLHFIANHFIATGGLRNFADVLSYLRNPIILVLEVFFLVVVATHAMLGVRAIVMDFGISDHAEKRLSQALTAIGVLTISYGLWLTWVIIR